MRLAVQAFAVSIKLETKRLSRPARLAAVFAAVLVALAVLYFAPAASGAVGLVSGFAVPANSSFATASGYRVKLVAGAHADTTTTVLNLKITPPAVVMSGARLSDQFGTRYRLRDGKGNSATGDQVLGFEPASGLASFTGMRFTLVVEQITVADRQKVSGPWTLRGVVLPRSGT